MMTSTGTLTLGDMPPVGMVASDGTFVLTLLLRDLMPVGSALSTWWVTWSGPQAQQFWQEHGQALLPGTRLHMVCTRIWSFGHRTTGATRIHATVVELSMPGVEANYMQKQAVAGVMPAFYQQNQ